MKNVIQKYNCGTLNNEYLDEKVIIQGWVKNTRRLGSITFIDMYDDKGITQIVYNSKNKDFDHLHNLKNESYIGVEGIVKLRKNPNINLKTGTIEVIANAVNVINEADVLPFVVANKSLTTETTRLNYRYLDLRRPVLHHNLFIKSELKFIIHQFFHEKKFLNIETPILSTPTPEGARNYMVPSRLNHHKYYALSQSPQLYKQMLMVGGFSQYYQIARCFRDEDFRSDRQPEFSQLDIEVRDTSFHEIKKLIEDLVIKIWKNIKNIDLQPNFPVLSYTNALDLYGTDKPDLRFDDTLINANSIWSKGCNSLFKKAIKHQKTIKACFTPFVASNKDLLVLNTIAQQYKATLMVLKYNADGTYQGSLKNKITDTELEKLQSILNIKQKSGTFFFIIDSYKEASFALGAIRAKFSDLFYDFKDDDHKFVWINEWPLFEFSKENQGFVSLHHPFTKPLITDQNKLRLETLSVKAHAYDLVLNGSEIGGGSLRIDDPELQKTIFSILGLSSKQIEKQFGWFIKALRYGTPPHGGIALGLDRIAMLLANADSIRDVIAFPKNNKGQDTVCGSPTQIDAKILEELKINLH